MRMVVVFPAPGTEEYVRLAQLDLNIQVGDGGCLAVRVSQARSLDGLGHHRLLGGPRIIALAERASASVLRKGAWDLPHLDSPRRITTQSS